MLDVNVRDDDKIVGFQEALSLAGKTALGAATAFKEVFRHPLQINLEVVALVTDIIDGAMDYGVAMLKNLRCNSHRKLSFGASVYKYADFPYHVLIMQDKTSAGPTLSKIWRGGLATHLPSAQQLYTIPPFFLSYPWGGTV